MVQAAPSADVKLVIGPSPNTSPKTLSTTEDQVQLLLSILKPKSLASVETSEGIKLSGALINSADFWRYLFASLVENGTFQAWLPEAEGM